MQLKNWRSRIGGLEGQLRQHEDKLLLLLTLIIGAAVGIVIVAFILLTENLTSWLYPSGAAAWRRLALPFFGALLAGFLISRYFPDARGSGIPQTKTALFVHDGYIRPRTAIGKFCSSVLSLASGVALGREGPSVQIGAGIASVLGRKLNLSPSKVKALVPVGAAAALAAAFNTPIAAVLFTLEEVVGDLHAPVLGSIVLSSAASWMTLRLLLGDEPLFHIPEYQLVSPTEFAVYALLGLIGGAVSVCFVKLLLWMRKQFSRLPKWTASVQPAVGGLVVGLLAWFVPEVLGVGYGNVSKALNGQLALGLMALLVLLKIVATATCYASGNAGGIFGPSLFIGAMIGGTVGSGAHYLFPDYTGSVGAYALVGMGTAFAGILRVPFTSVIMIFEMTRDYAIIVPLMISNLISYYVSHRLQPLPIYESLLHQESIDLPKAGGAHRDVLTVREAMQDRCDVFSDDATVLECIPLLGDDDRNAVPVVREGLLRGMVTLGELRAALESGLGNRKLSQVIELQSHPQLSNDELPYVYADQSVDIALRRMARIEINLLPVVTRAAERRLVGTISINNVMAKYGLSGNNASSSGWPAG
jgi:chloride channel protein, CIC family